MVNAFIDGETGGNPAGVILAANDLTPTQKLSIAGEVGLSETAFVSESQTATAKLEFYTPVRQITHCGHATIATFSLLHQQGILGEGNHSKETIDGNRDILLESDLAFMEQRAPTYTSLEDNKDVLEAVMQSLNISGDRLLGGFAPDIVNTGNRFLVIPLEDERTLASLNPDFDRISIISDRFDLIGYYLFSLHTKRPNRIAGTRMFAPRYGITEEAATGMAAGPLACYLHDIMGRTQGNMQIEQGYLMSQPSPSVITVKLERSEGEIKSLMAGGSAKSAEVLWIDV
ncbi:MAG: PhzF family phenazine biosynthesis protein [Gammaproteobacteria bacterium]|nr:PhzF family phenazine biosynthesis protein [Gammaproteobacteria bacterium]